MPIQSVCPPYLPILLGIVKKHHVLLEKDLHEVDLEKAREIEMSKVKIDNTLFYKCMQNLGSHRKLINDVGYLSNYIHSDVATMSDKDIADQKIPVRTQNTGSKAEYFSGILVSKQCCT